MSIKCINIFQSKALKNLPKLAILGLKINHLATLDANSCPLSGLQFLLKTYMHNMSSLLEICVQQIISGDRGMKKIAIKLSAAVISIKMWTYSLL
jgi:hypothetical protein